MKIEDAVNDPTYNGAFNFNDGVSQAGFRKSESWIDKNGYLNMYAGDKSTAWKTSQRFVQQRIKAPRFYMYHTPTQTLVNYDKNRIKSRKKVGNGKLQF